MKPMTWWCSVIALALLAPRAGAAVVVTLPRDGSHLVWVKDKDGVPIAGPILEEGPKALLDTGDAKSTGAWMVAAWNVDSGNTALATAPAGESPRVSFTDRDFNRIALVRIAVKNAEGEAPRFAVVTLTDGAKEEHATALGPADGGVAVFRDVVAGEGAVRVQQGERENFQTLSVRLPLERDEAALDLPLSVSLPEGFVADTDAASANGAAVPEQIVKRRASSLLGFVIAVIILGGGGYALYRALIARGVTAESALLRMGVVLPEDDAVPPPAQVIPSASVDPTVCPFCGGKKPENGPCPRCDLGPSPAPGTPSASPDAFRLVAVSGPRAGEVFPIAPRLAVGRDPGQDLAVTEDAGLSRRHAVLEVEGGGVTALDQGSSNGTWVNGQRIQRQRLRVGDEIRMGSSVFRLEV